MCTWRVVGDGKRWGENEEGSLSHSQNHGRKGERKRRVRQGARDPASWPDHRRIASKRAEGSVTMGWEEREIPVIAVSPNASGLSANVSELAPERSIFQTVLVGYNWFRRKVKDRDKSVSTE